MARKTTLAAKLYVSDSNVHSGKRLTDEELNKHATFARHLSTTVEGVVELHIITEGGRGNEFIDAFATDRPFVYDNGRELYREEQG